MDEFARHPLFFVGATWDSQADWNDPDSWESRYAPGVVPLDPGELGRDGLIVSRTDEHIVETLIEHAGLPRAAGAPPLQVLDAGCGILNLPYLVARLGCLVSALDFSQSVIRLAEELAPHRERWPLSKHVVEFLSEEVAARLPVATEPPGRVTYRALDWFDDALEPGRFDAVYVNNSLRLSRKAYWRRSLSRFRDLLAPGGLLITTCQNAVAIRHEVADLAEKAGFDATLWHGGRVDPGRRRPDDPACQRYIGLWPTG